MNFETFRQILKYSDTIVEQRSVNVVTRATSIIGHVHANLTPIFSASAKLI